MMKTVTLTELANDVATLLGETLQQECQPEESPFPGIEERVRILAPGLLARLLINPSEENEGEMMAELSPGLYLKLVNKLCELIKES